MWIKRNSEKNFYLASKPIYMQYIKPLLIKLFVIAFLLTACTENEKKQADNTITNEDTLAGKENTQKEEKQNEKVAEENKKEEITGKSGADKLEGAWEIKRAIGSSVKSNLGTVYTFDGDNLTLSKDGFNNPGKTEKTDNTFSFQTEGSQYKFIYDYKFDGDTLVASMQNSNGQTFYMVKK
jgi:hypothetical protein